MSRSFGVCTPVPDLFLRTTRNPIFLADTPSEEPRSMPVIVERKSPISVVVRAAPLCPYDASINSLAAELFRSSAIT